MAAFWEKPPHFRPYSPFPHAYINYDRTPAPQWNPSDEAMRDAELEDIPCSEQSNSARQSPSSDSDILFAHPHILFIHPWMIKPENPSERLEKWHPPPLSPTVQGGTSYFKADIWEAIGDLSYPQFQFPPTHENELTLEEVESLMERMERANSGRKVLAQSAAR
ncbi:hypothetical protein EJ06DRAFT_585848 [Trichodelitschia bisporula]|uniref:Uncharacterized protein n=1 Tax=Trichodelitschia bisporula TaxID=703511 RepID=A0A6G1HHY5_9PEZI|nr:hypothetical protein EJ06DRAFT_585848 [Trichodelitschia bisporula]